MPHLPLVCLCSAPTAAHRKIKGSNNSQFLLFIFIIYKYFCLRKENSCSFLDLFNPETSTEEASV